MGMEILKASREQIIGKSAGGNRMWQKPCNPNSIVIMTLNP